MSKIGTIYVEVKGDYSEFQKDLTALRTTAKNSAGEISNAMNTAINPAKAQQGVAQLSTGLKQLAQSAKLPAANIQATARAISTGLSQVARQANLTDKQFQALNEKMLRHQRYKQAEQAMRGVANAAGLSRKEIRQLGLQMGYTYDRANKMAVGLTGASKSSQSFAASASLMYVKAIALVFAVKQVTDAVGRMTKAIWDAGQATLVAQNAFTVLSGSAAGADKEFKFLRDTAKELGLNFYTLREGFIGFYAAAKQTTLSMDEVHRVFKSVSNAGAILGLSNERMKLTFLALEQIMSKGKVSMEEIRRQMGDNLYGAFQIAAKAMGMTTQEFDAALKKGTVFSEEFIPKFARALEDAFQGSIADSVKAVNELSQSWEDFKNAIADAGAMSGMTSVLETLTDTVKALTKATKAADEGGVVSFFSRLNILNWFGNYTKALGLLHGGAIQASDLINANYEQLALIVQLAKDGVLTPLDQLQIRESQLVRFISQVESSLKSNVFSFGDEAALAAYKKELADVRAEMEKLTKVVPKVAEENNKLDDKLKKNIDDLTKITDKVRKFLNQGESSGASTLQKNLNAVTNSTNAILSAIGKFESKHSGVDLSSLVDVVLDSEDLQKVKILNKELENLQDRMVKFSHKYKLDGLTEVDRKIAQIDEDTKKLIKATKEYYELMAKHTGKPTDPTKHIQEITNESNKAKLKVQLESYKKLFEGTFKNIFSDTLKVELGSFKDYFKKFMDDLIDIWASKLSKMASEKISDSLINSLSQSKTGGAGGAGSFSGMGAYAGAGAVLAGFYMMHSYSENDRKKQKAEFDQWLQERAAFQDELAAVMEKGSEGNYTAQLQKLNEAYDEAYRKAAYYRMAIMSVNEAYQHERELLEKEYDEKRRDLTVTLQGVILGTDSYAYQLEQINIKYDKLTEQAEDIGVSTDLVTAARKKEIAALKQTEKSVKDYTGIISGYTSLITSVTEYQAGIARQNWGGAEYIDYYNDLTEEIETLNSNSDNYYEDALSLYQDQFDAIQALVSIQQEALNNLKSADLSLGDMIDRLTGGDLASVQSQEYFQSKYTGYKTGIQSAFDTGDILKATQMIAEWESFIPEYLKFMTGMGDYNSLANTVAADLAEVQGNVKTQQSMVEEYLRQINESMTSVDSGVNSETSTMPELLKKQLQTMQSQATKEALTKVTDFTGGSTASYETSALGKLLAEYLPSGGIGGLIEAASSSGTLSVNSTMMGQTASASVSQGKSGYYTLPNDLGTVYFATNPYGDVDVNYSPGGYNQSMMNETLKYQAAGAAWWTATAQAAVDAKAANKAKNAWEAVFADTGIGGTSIYGFSDAKENDYSDSQAWANLKKLYGFFDAAGISYNRMSLQDLVTAWTAYAFGGTTYNQKVDMPYGVSHGVSIGDSGIHFYGAGGLMTSPSIGGELGDEWAVPTYEPQRRNFLRDVGADPEKIGAAVAKALIPYLSQGGGGSVQLYLDGKVVADAMVTQARTNSDYRQSIRRAAR